MNVFAPPPLALLSTADSFSYIALLLPAIGGGGRSEIAEAVYALHRSRILYPYTYLVVSLFVGFGRLMGMLAILSFVILKSFRFAPSTVMPIGTPPPSVSTRRFVPCFARSVGFDPLFFPSKRRSRHGSIHRTEAPVNAFEFVVPFQALLPELFEYSSAIPFLKPTVS